MSIYDKSSLVLIPSGTKTSKVYSQKPTNGDGDFTFSRSTAATRVNADGNIEKETMNLWTYSNDISDHTLFNASVSSGQSDPFGGNTAWAWRETTANGQHYGRPQQSYNQVANTIYSVSFYVKPINKTTIYITTTSNNAGGFASCTFDFTTGTFTNQAAGVAGTFSEELTDGWWRVGYSYVVSVTGAYQIYYNNLSTYTGNTANGYNIYGFQLNKGVVPNSYIETTTTALYGGITDNVPRLDYTDSSCPALLLEPQRTNLIDNTEYYAGYDLLGNVSLTTNYGISPEGNQNGSRITGLNGAGTNDLRKQLALNCANKTLSFSIYLKGNGTLRQQISNGTDQAHTQVVTLTSEWKRHTLTGTFNSTAVSTTYLVLDDLGVTATEYEIWGTQCEEGSYATSYIPTYGTSVTRNADSCLGAGNSSLFNVNGGVVFGEFAALSDDLTFRQFGIVGTTGNEVNLSLDSVSNRVGGIVRSGGTYYTTNYVVTDTTQVNKVALKYEGSDVKLFVNGILVDTHTTASAPQSLSEFNFAIGTNNSNKFFGKINQALVFPTALTDTELATLTTI